MRAETLTPVLARAAGPDTEHLAPSRTGPGPRLSVPVGTRESSGPLRRQTFLTPFLLFFLSLFTFSLILSFFVCVFPVSISFSFFLSFFLSCFLSFCFSFLLSFFLSSQILKLFCHTYLCFMNPYIAYFLYLCIQRYN